MNQSVLDVLRVQLAWLPRKHLQCIHLRYIRLSEDYFSYSNGFLNLFYRNWRHSVVSNFSRPTLQHTVCLKRQCICNPYIQLNDYCKHPSPCMWHHFCDIFSATHKFSKLLTNFGFAWKGWIDHMGFLQTNKFTSGKILDCKAIAW